MIWYIILVVVTLLCCIALFAGNSSGYRDNYSRNTPVSSGRVDNRQPFRNQQFMSETGPIRYMARDPYTMRDVSFSFNYKQLYDGSWRAYIVQMPSLNGRSGDPYTTNREYDGNAYYVYWSQPIMNLTDVQNVSREWADRILEYIATGRF